MKIVAPANTSASKDGAKDLRPSRPMPQQEIVAEVQAETADHAPRGRRGAAPPSGGDGLAGGGGLLDRLGRHPDLDGGWVPRLRRDGGGSALALRHRASASTRRRPRQSLRERAAGTAVPQTDPNGPEAILGDPRRQTIRNDPAAPVQRDGIAPARRPPVGRGEQPFARGPPGSTGSSSRSSTSTDRFLPSEAGFVRPEIDAPTRSRSPTAMPGAGRLRDRIAAAFGVDPSRLPVRADGMAARLTAARGAQGLVYDGIAYVHPHLVNTAEGPWVVAHELAHLLQAHAPGSGDLPAAEVEAEALAAAFAAGRALWRPRRRLPAAAVPLRKGTRDDAIEHPIKGRLTTSLYGLKWTKTSATEMVEGVQRKVQYDAAVLSALTGGSYSKALLEDYTSRSWLGEDFTGGLPAADVAKADEKGPPSVTTQSALAWFRVRWLQIEKKVTTTLTPAQRAMLDQAAAAEVAWTIIRDDAGKLGLPGWYTEAMFLKMLGSYASRVKTFTTVFLGAAGSAVTVTALKAAFTPQAKTIQDAVETLIAPLVRDAKLIERIRRDADLTDHPVYQALWRTAKARWVEGTPKPPRGKKGNIWDTEMAADLLWYIRSQKSSIIDPARESGGGSARRVLLDRFERYLGFRASSTGGDGNQVLTEGVSRANAAPLRATLGVFPALEAPFNDRASNADYTFAMELSFTDVFEAFAGYHYQWELIEIPAKDRAKLKDLAEDFATRGYRPTWGDVLALRMKREVDYARTDLRRAIDGLVITMGPPNIGVVGLVAAARALSAIGTVIRTIIDAITQPRNEKRIPISKDRSGLYVVRCIATPRGADKAKAEFIRSASVAWVHMTVREAEDMAKLRLDYDLLVGEASALRLAAIEAILRKDDELVDDDDKMEPKERAGLEREAKTLRIVLGGDLEAILKIEKRRLNEQLTAIGSESEESRKRAAPTTAAIRDRIRDIDRILATRKARRKDAGATKGTLLPARFVGDKGQTMKLALEAFDVDGATDHTYLISDSTSPDGGDQEAWGITPVFAIRRGVVELLEGGSGYGRGFVRLHVPRSLAGGNGLEITLRIEASLTQIAMEGIEGLTMVATVALMAAAPFTGGASLALMVPIGLIGAIPSAYRLIDRATSHTLRSDMAAWMDVLNIVGAVVGLGQASAASRGVSSAGLLWQRTGKALMVVGMGTDGMSTVLGQIQFMEEMEKIAAEVEAGRISAGEGRARMMMGVGQQLLDVGMQIGGDLSSRAVNDHPRSKKWKIGDAPQVDPLSPKPADGAAPKPADSPKATEGPKAADGAATGAPGTKPDTATDPSAAGPTPDTPTPAVGPADAYLVTEGARRRASGDVHRRVRRAVGDHVPVFTDSGMPDKGIEVRTRKDAHGMVHEVAIVVGVKASRGEIAGLPARQAKAILLLKSDADGLKALMARHDAMAPDARPLGADQALRSLAEQIATFQEDVRAGRKEPEAVVDFRSDLAAVLTAQASVLGITPEVRSVRSKSLAKGLPHAMRKGVSVQRLHGDPKVQGTTVQVRFDVGPFGLIRDIHVVAGPDAKRSHIQEHVTTVRALQGYQGLSGVLRNLYRRAAGLPSTRTKGFEAALEKSKLRSIIQNRTRQLAEGPPQPAADRKALLAEIAGYKKQLADFEKQLTSLEKGRGLVAATGPAKPAKKAPAKKAGATDAPAKEPPPGPTADTDPAARKKTDDPTAAPGTPAAKPVFDPTTARAADAGVVPLVRAEVATLLGVAEGTIEIRTSQGRVAVNPEGHGPTAGKTTIRLDADSTMAQVLAVVKQHNDLVASRDAAIEAGTWTGNDEARLRGWPDPTPASDYSWAFRDKDLSLVRKRVKDAQGNEIPAKKFSPDADDFVNKPTPGGDQQFSNPKISKTKAFGELGGNDPATPFGKWVKSVTLLGLATRSQLIARMPDKPGQVTHRTARSAYVKHGGTSMVHRIVAHISDNANLKKRTEFKALKKKFAAAGTPFPEAAFLDFLSQQLMIRLTQGDTGGALVFHHDGVAYDLGSTPTAKRLPGLHFKEVGSYAERWFQTRYSPAAEGQIKITAAQAKAAGITFTEKSRDIDLSEKRTTTAKNPMRQMEIKNLTDSIDLRSKTQIGEQIQLLGKDVTITEKGGSARTIHYDRLDVVVPDPRGGLANATWMAEMITTHNDPRFGFVLFDGNGVKRRFPPEPGGTPAASPAMTPGERLAAKNTWEKAIIDFLTAPTPTGGATP